MADDLPYIISPGRKCNRETCGNEAENGKEYCSRDCWRADNPEVA